MPGAIDLQGIGGLGAIRPSLRSAATGGGEDGVSFKDVLSDRIAEVNSLQQQADAAMTNFAAAKTGNLSEMFVAIQKTDLAFRTLMTIRNKLFEAYEEISRLRV